MNGWGGRCIGTAHSIRSILYNIYSGDRLMRVRAFPDRPILSLALISAIALKSVS